MQHVNMVGSLSAALRVQNATLLDEAVVWLIYRLNR